VSVPTDLSAHYEKLEAELNVVEGPDFASLVVPNGNHAQAVHRWFHFKEGFSCDLFNRLDDDFGLAERTSLSVLDPFLGSGTTLLSALDWAAAHPTIDVTAVGIERNPFLYLLSHAKIEAASDRSFDSVSLDPVLACARAKPSKLTETPPLSTFESSKYFRPNHVSTLVAIRDALLFLPDGLPRRLGLLALAASVEPVSCLRRDGRTMRYAPGKPVIGPAAEFRRRMLLVRDDLDRKRSFPSAGSSFQVFEGDGRRPSLALDHDFGADLVVFSPPYPNNIDYTEVYKLEAWILGLYETAEEFRLQRKRTLRSHPSILFGDTDRLGGDRFESAIDSLVEPIERAIPSDRYQTERKRMIRGYVEDLALTLAEARAVSTPSAICVVVVGNSLHGHGSDQLLVAADLLIASIASHVGWTPKNVTVARRPIRRSTGEPRLRESLITLQAAAAPAFEVTEPTLDARSGDASPA
jgi:hypothetical protein